MKYLKQKIKKLSFFRYFIYTFLHPHIKTKILNSNINRYYSNINKSLETFKKIPQIPNLIISLTSFPARMDYIEYTLFSLIKQTIRPQKIILWLSLEEFPNKEKDISDNLLRYNQFGLEINFVNENIKSFKKLVFAIKEYPENVIVTSDDDVYYKPDWLYLLFITHKLNPKDIISHKIHRISFSNKTIKPYLKWKNYPSNVSFLNFFVGYGGVLYPPGSLFKDVTNTALFLSLCPTADDIWFYTMALLNNTRIRKIKVCIKKCFPIDYELTENWKNVPSLMDINWINNKNDIQLKAVLEHYSLYDKFYDKYA